MPSRKRHLVLVLFVTLVGGSPSPLKAADVATPPGDILAGWAQMWEWHATPGGKIWRWDGKRWDRSNGPFLDCFAEWGWQRRLEANHEQQVFNLAIGGNWFGNVTSETDFSQWEMNLKFINIYALPKGFNGDQELPLTIDGSTFGSGDSTSPPDRGSLQLGSGPGTGNGPGPGPGPGIGPGPEPRTRYREIDDYRPIERPKAEKVPELVLYITCGAPAGPGKVYQVSAFDGRVLGRVKNPIPRPGSACTVTVASYWPAPVVAARSN